LEAGGAAAQPEEHARRSPAIAQLRQLGALIDRMFFQAHFLLLKWVCLVSFPSSIKKREGNYGSAKKAFLFEFSGFLFEIVFVIYFVFEFSGYKFEIIYLIFHFCYLRIFSLFLLKLFHCHIAMPFYMFFSALVIFIYLLYIYVLFRSYIYYY